MERNNPTLALDVHERPAPGSLLPLPAALVCTSAWSVCRCVRVRSSRACVVAHARQREREGEREGGRESARVGISWPCIDSRETDTSEQHIYISRARMSSTRDMHTLNGERARASISMSEQHTIYRFMQHQLTWARAYLLASSIPIYRAHESWCCINPAARGAL